MESSPFVSEAVNQSLSQSASQLSWTSVSFNVYYYE